MQNRVDLETQPKLQQCHQRRGNQQRTEQILKKNESAEALPFFYFLLSCAFFAINIFYIKTAFILL